MNWCTEFKHCANLMRTCFVGHPVVAWLSRFLSFHLTWQNDRTPLSPGIHRIEDWLSQKRSRAVQINFTRCTTKLYNAYSITKTEENVRNTDWKQGRAHGWNLKSRFPPWTRLISRIFYSALVCRWCAQGDRYKRLMVDVLYGTRTSTWCSVLYEQVRW